MHRHGYKGRKFGRQRAQRQALLRGLADSLILNEKIETTWPKAKELSRYTEKLISKAKRGGLHNRRSVIAGLNTLEAASKLVDDIAPKLTSRQSGHLTIKRTHERRGDGALLATIAFVDDLKPAAKKTAVKPAAKKPKPAGRPKPAKPKARTVKEAAAKTETKK